MINLFDNLIGYVPGLNSDLKIVLAALFILLLISEFCRFFELIIDFAFGRRK